MGAALADNRITGVLRVVETAQHIDNGSVDSYQLHVGTLLGETRQVRNTC